MALYYHTQQQFYRRNCCRCDCLIISFSIFINNIFIIVFLFYLTNNSWAFGSLLSYPTTILYLNTFIFRIALYFVSYPAACKSTTKRYKHCISTTIIWLFVCFISMIYSLLILNCHQMSTHNKTELNEKSCCSPH